MGYGVERDCGAEGDFGGYGGGLDGGWARGGVREEFLIRGTLLHEG